MKAFPSIFRQTLIETDAPPPSTQHSSLVALSIRNAMACVLQLSKLKIENDRGGGGGGGRRKALEFSNSTLMPQ